MQLIYSLDSPGKLGIIDSLSLLFLLVYSLDNNPGPLVGMSIPLILVRMKEVVAKAKYKILKQHETICELKEVLRRLVVLHALEQKQY